MKLNFVLSWISSKFFVKMIETKGFKIKNWFQDWTKGFIKHNKIKN
jgi:hypothetical protein